MQSSKKYIVHSIDEIESVSKAILSDFQNPKVWAFYGDMGVGKTTTIKALCKSLGVHQTVNSPSFAIINEYSDLHENPIYHFDFYRINDEREAYDLGYENYFYSGDYCFVEWPEKIPSLLPIPHLQIFLSEEDDHTRVILVDIIEK